MFSEFPRSSGFVGQSAKLVGEWLFVVEKNRPPDRRKNVARMRKRIKRQLTGTKSEKVCLTRSSRPAGDAPLCFIGEAGNRLISPEP